MVRVNQQVSRLLKAPLMVPVGVARIVLHIVGSLFDAIIRFPSKLASYPSGSQYRERGGWEETEMR